MRPRNIQRSLFILFALLVAVFSAGSAAAAAKQRLKCECINCTYAQGRAQTTYVFDVNFNATLAGRQAYNAAESAAMKAADQAAIAAGAAALNGAPSCPGTCENPPFWQVTHGPPFAGGTGGNGIARSRWKVTYSCVKPAVLVEVPQTPQTAPPPAQPPCILCNVSTTPMVCTSGAPDCPYSQLQDCTASNGCPYAQQVCTGPGCTGGSSCRGPDNDQRIIQLTSDLRASLPGNQTLLSNYTGLFGAISAGGPGSGSLVSQLSDTSAQLMSALTMQDQRISVLNALTPLPPCEAGGPPPQGGGGPPSVVPIIPFQFGIGVGGGGRGEDRGGGDRGRGGNERRP